MTLAHNLKDMKTDFFQNITQLNVPGNWKISLHTADNVNFTISALFTALHCGDNAAKTVPPMLLKGTAEELDEGFFEAIIAPVQQTAGLYADMEGYMKELEQARLASKMEQDKKAAEKKQNAGTNTAKSDGIEVPKTQKPSRDELNKAYDEAMEKVNEQMKKLRFTDALAILPAAADYPHKEKEITKKAEYLKQQVNLYEKAVLNFNA
jgi:PRTRC genetic system protein E